MKKSEAIKEIMQMVNYHDGGHMETYVANNLIDFLTEQLHMLPPQVRVPGKWQSMGDDRRWEPEDED